MRKLFIQIKPPFVNDLFRDDLSRQREEKKKKGEPKVVDPPHHMLIRLQQIDFPLLSLSLNHAPTDAKQKILFDLFFSSSSFLLEQY